MNATFQWLRRRLCPVASLVLLLLATAALGDDTDIYRSLYDIESRSGQPQVMIIFDTSVSMQDVISEDGVETTKIDIARSVIANLVSGNPQVDFGLSIFNDNYETAPDGGRIVYPLPGKRGAGTETQRQALLDTLAALRPVTTTPLCETYYEVFRYFKGLPPLYGTKPQSRNDRNLGYSPEAIADGEYVSPLRPCEPLYLIYMTDGTPNFDTAANDAIRDLVRGERDGNAACQRYSAADTLSGEAQNCMPELAYYLSQLGTFSGRDSAGREVEQGPVTTYTIGFDTDQQLLVDTASPLNIGSQQCPVTRHRTRFHGDDACVGYFTADDAEQLQSAFQVAIDDILSRSTTFSAPAVSAAFTTNAQSLDRLYLPRFLPRNEPRWSGNVKRLQFVAQQQWRDVRGNPAFNATTGDIRDSAFTWWSDAQALDAPDGNDVEAGGIGGLLRQRVDEALKAGGSDGRRIFTDRQGRLTPFDADLAVEPPEKWGLPADSDDASITDLIRWARGADRDDENGNEVRQEARPWLMGDILHADPIALNYGATTDAEATGDGKLYLAFGTNAGFLHFVDGDSGEEQWSFTPESLTALHRTLRENVPVTASEETLQHPYGLDSPPAYVRIDANRDGRIRGADGDRMLLVFGQRRGGRHYYALDVTDPETPTLAWTLSPEGAFTELGQTWGTPMPTRVPGHEGPVFVIAGGYDPGRDDPARGSHVGDDQGRALYIVDALTGALVFRADPTTPAHFRQTPFPHAIAASPTVVDDDSDGIADRIYLADVGGDLWRLDLDPSVAADGWKIQKVAELGGQGVNNRRFFNSVDFVTLADGGEVVDLLLVGSGDRANPKAGGEGAQSAPVADAFFAVRDRGIEASVIQAKWLSDVTSDAFCERDAEPNAATACRNVWADAAGWKLFLNGGYTLDLPGAKVLSASVTLDGVAYFSAYVPDEPESICIPVVGRSYLFGVDLRTAAAGRYVSRDVDDVREGRAVEAGAYLLGRPALLIRGSELYLQGIGAADLEALVDPSQRGEGNGLSFPFRATRSYWYETTEAGT
ncbi:pilus assembly protein [Salinicola aestuarinus]|uniref:pilus assembly protein n=1 Tax=Salinicola aestuarinus TaxID=1949082 RepID=UPI000DA18423|nr:PilC/PilY family type IV pilus protein [Salinicola aestuarinus]